MPHKLALGAKLVSLSDYSRLLSSNEAVAGCKTQLTITIENIGDTSIPETSLMVTLQKPAGLGSFTLELAPLKTPPLKPAQTFTSNIAIDEKTLVEPGLWILTAVVQQTDLEPVEYYFSKNLPPLQGRWVVMFHLTDRHQLDIQQTLEKLLEKIGRET